MLLGLIMLQYSEHPMSEYLYLLFLLHILILYLGIMKLVLFLIWLGILGMAARTTNVVKAVINYQQIGANQINAWIGQLFPVMVAVPAINNGVININNFQGTAWAFSDFT